MDRDDLNDNIFPNYKGIPAKCLAQEECTPLVRWECLVSLSNSELFEILQELYLFREHYPIRFCEGLSVNLSETVWS